jgi:hypothetical protein
MHYSNFDFQTGLNVIFLYERFMMQCKQSTMIFISGAVWLLVGMFLMPLGIYLLVSSLAVQVEAAQSYPLIKPLSSLSGGWEQAVLMLLCAGLFVGYLKGKFVLGKSARQGVSRIQQFSNPTHLSNIYSLKYYILILGMMGLGMGIKFFGLADDIRGFIDVAIGAALINGARVYIRSGLEMRTLEEKHLNTCKG